MKTMINAPAFDDIVFEKRNREYGAYQLRKNYYRNLFTGMVIGVVILGTAVIAPFINAKTLESKQKGSERQVNIQLEEFDAPEETVAPPPPPPPPAESVQQAKYVPPVVVDSVKPEEGMQLLTADQAVVEIRNEAAVEIIEEIKEEIQEEVPEQEPFYVVEEMPMFPGGNPEMQKFIYDHIVYPEICRENNIQGKVIVKFCVNSGGTVDKISIVKGVDPQLDAEAMRVIGSLPSFRPGKQGGKPVPVWYVWPINFQLK